MKELQLDACAKINLTLDVTGRREDGYHLLESVMQSISLSDAVSLRLRAEPGVHLTCSDPALADPGNTAFRAAQRFLSEQNYPGGVVLHIEKNIPSQAGLGGASADAAAVLVGLNELLETNLSTEQLQAIGLQIGADVPFCIAGGTRLVQGIGEAQSPLPPLRDCAILVCKPPWSMSTGEAYARIDRTPLSHPDNKAMLQALRQGDLTAIGCLLHNAFEAVQEQPGLNKLLLWLMKNGALGARMTGSGSAVFALFSNEKTAEGCCARLLPTLPESFVCHPTRAGVSVSIE